MLKYLTKSKLFVIIFVLTSLVYSAGTAAIALVLAAIIEAATGDSINELIIIAAFAFAFLVLYVILQYVYEKLKNTMLMNAAKKLKSDVFSSIMSKDIPDFEKRNSASYINELTTNVNMVGDLYFSNFFALLHLSVSFLTAVIITVYFQPALLLVMFLLGALSFAVSKFTGKGIDTIAQSVSESSQVYQVGIKEYFSGFRIIKTFSILNHINALHDTKNDDMENRKLSYKLKVTLVGCISLLVGFSSTIAIMGVTAALSIRGLVSVGAVFAVGHLMGQVTSPITSLPGILVNFKSAKPIIAALNEFLNSKPQEDANNETNEVSPDGFKRIEIRDMSFAYGESPALASVNLTFESGKKYVIVGGSGSGKTTLISLLLGYYDNYDGSIKYGEHEVKSIKKANIYKMVGSVLQETFLFDDTLKNNLTLYDDRFTESEINEAVKHSGLTEFVDGYPGKLNGSITENGKNISGGERQRISLARVLLRKQPALLLDEFTGSLDSEKAFEIEQYLLTRREITLIAITHRLNKALLKQYDSVIVLRNGQVAEHGSYEELVNTNGGLDALLSVSDRL